MELDGLGGFGWVWRGFERVPDTLMRFSEEVAPREAGRGTQVRHHNFGGSILGCQHPVSGIPAAGLGGWKNQISPLYPKTLDSAWSVLLSYSPQICFSDISQTVVLLTYVLFPQNLVRQLASQKYPKLLSCLSYCPIPLKILFPRLS